MCRCKQRRLPASCPPALRPVQNRQRGRQRANRQAVSDAVMERCGAAVSFFDKSRPIQADGVIAFDFEPRLARAPLLYLGYDKPQNPCVRRYIDHSKITVRLGENYEFLQAAIGRKVNLNDAHIILKSKYNNYNLDDFHRENFQISQSIN